MNIHDTSFGTVKYLLLTTLITASSPGCLPEDELDLPPPPAGGVPDAVCGDVSLETGAKVLFVLDKSGTMFADELAWDHDDDPQTPPIPRWQSLHSVVEFVVDRFDDDFSLGALMFPSVASGCEVNRTPEIPVAANNGEELLAVLPEADAYFDAYHLTPLPTALETAVDYLLGFDEEDTRAIVLVSDGVPSASCDGTLSDATQTAREAWEDHGIPTYVVGVAIEEAYAQEYALLASAGGRPDPGTAFYDTQDELQLQAAIDEIAKDIPDCRIKLDQIPTYPERLSIEVAGESVPSLADCGDEDGWVYADAEHRVIELCGASCQALEAGETDVVARYGCPAEGEETGN